MSVLAVGADSSGRADSSAAFQRAIDSGKPVWVPRGTYDLVKPIVLRNNCQIRGEPGARLVADPANSGRDGALLMVGRRVRNVVVSGLVFDGNARWIRNQHVRVVYINGGDRVLFDNDRFENTAGLALVFSGKFAPVTASGVRNSYFDNIGFAWLGKRDPKLSEAGVAIVFSNGRASADLGNFADGNTIRAVGGDAIDIQGQGHFRARANRLELGQRGWKPRRMGPGVTYGVGGFFVYGNSADVELAGNYISGATGQCIDTGFASNLRILSNVISNCGGAGVSIGSSVDGFTVSGNTFALTNQSASWAIPNVIHQGAISFSCGQNPCFGVVSNGVVANNKLPGETAHNTWIQRGVTLANVRLGTPVVQQTGGR